MGEPFFAISFEIDEIETIDLLLSRYANIEFIMNMELDVFIDLVHKAQEKRMDEQYFEMWKEMIPFFNLQAPFNIPAMSLDEFKRRIVKQNQPESPKEDRKEDRKKSEEELIQWAERIKNADLNGGG